MAIGTFDGSGLQMQQQMQQQMLQQQMLQRQMQVGDPLTMVPRNSVPAGSMIIADSFSTSEPNDKYSHGEMVKMSAAQDGFKGKVYTQAHSMDFARINAKNTAEQGFFKPNATAAETQANVSAVAINDYVSLVEGQTKHLEGATASGAKNSVLNMSTGGSVAQITQRLYGTASNAWYDKASPQARVDGTAAAQNFATAYGLSMDKLKSSDPKVSGPERAKLQGALMNGVSGSISSSPEAGSAKKAYTTAVGRFESNRNSVVIASGNEGQNLDDMVSDSHGYKPKNIPQNFNTNYLDTPEATMVGATRWFNGSGTPQERVAGYSNKNSGVDLYASGSLSLNGNQSADAYGTSFAAPRVSATMATLHKQNPNMSSRQIESLMQQSMTHQLENSGSSVSVLDYQKSSDFMVGRKPQ